MSGRPLRDKVAVVTGGASGIGLAIAERFVADGLQVVIGDIQAEAGSEVAQRLGGLFVEGDLSHRANCKMLIDRAVESFGTVHILVNNAGFQHIAPIEVFPEDTWDRLLAVMLTAPFLLTKYVWPTMKAQVWGRVVNIASIHGLVASPFKSAYITAKHGLIGLTRAAAHDEGAREQRDKVLAWTLNNLYDPRGYFYYQKTARRTKRLCLMRWCNGWMCRALASVLSRQPTGLTG